MISDLRLKRAAPPSRGGHPFRPTVGLGGAGLRHRSSTLHTRVSTTSQGRAVIDRVRGGPTTPPQTPWCCRTGGSASEPSSIPSRQNMYTFYSRGSDPASGSAASTVNCFYRRFDQLSSVKIADTVGPVMHNDIVFEALDHQLGGGSPITSCGHDRLEGSAAKRRLQLWVRPLPAHPSSRRESGPLSGPRPCCFRRYGGVMNTITSDH